MWLWHLSQISVLILDGWGKTIDRMAKDLKILQSHAEGGKEVQDVQDHNLYQFYQQI
jgi:hypothetical protein